MRFINDFIKNTVTFILSDPLLDPIIINVTVLPQTISERPVSGYMLAFIILQ